jgi:GT2 family glycosyltransferase
MAFLQRIGLMCEDYFLFFEETDWAVRARGQFALAYAAKSIVYHKVGRSIGTSSLPSRKSTCCDYYAIRNRLFFTRKFHPEALPTVYLSVLMALFVRILMGKWDRAKMIAALLAGQEINV